MLAWKPGTGTAAHPFNLEVKGRDLIDDVDEDSIDVTLPGPGENGSLDCTVQDPTSSIVIEEWDHVRLIEHAAPRPILFGGFVQSVTTTAWARGGRTHRVRCAGYGILLDRRLIVGFEPFSGLLYTGSIGGLLIMLITRFGQVITAAGYIADDTDHDAIATTKTTVLVSADWATGFSGLGDQGRIANTTLRQALDQWGTLGHDWRQTPLPVPVPFISWVDSYARYHATWIPGDGPDDSYEGAATAVTESSNSPQEEATLEGDGSDYATSVWVQDQELEGDPDESLMIRGTPHPVAGDLEISVPVRGGVLLDHVQATGYQELEFRAGSTVRATYRRTSATPLDWRPGMSVLWTSAQLGLSAQKFRMLGVQIRFLGGLQREYSVHIGGRLAPSLARETADIRQSVRGRFNIP